MTGHHDPANPVAFPSDPTPPPPRPFSSDRRRKISDTIQRMTSKLLPKKRSIQRLLDRDADNDIDADKTNAPKKTRQRTDSMETVRPNANATSNEREKLSQSAPPRTRKVSERSTEKERLSGSTSMGRPSSLASTPSKLAEAILTPPATAATTTTPGRVSELDTPHRSDSTLVPSMPKIDSVIDRTDPPPQPQNRPTSSPTPSPPTPFVSPRSLPSPPQATTNDATIKARPALSPTKSTKTPPKLQCPSPTKPASPTKAPSPTKSASPTKATTNNSSPRTWTRTHSIHFIDFERRESSPVNLELKVGLNGNDGFDGGKVQIVDVDLDGEGEGETDAMEVDKLDEIPGDDSPTSLFPPAAKLFEKIEHFNSTFINPSPKDTDKPTAALFSPPPSSATKALEKALEAPTAPSPARPPTPTKPRTPEDRYDLHIESKATHAVVWDVQEYTHRILWNAQLILTDYLPTYSQPHPPIHQIRIQCHPISPMNYPPPYRTRPLTTYDSLHECLIYDQNDVELTIEIKPEEWKHVPVQPSAVPRRKWSNRFFVPIPLSLFFPPIEFVADPLAYPSSRPQPFRLTAQLVLSNDKERDANEQRITLMQTVETAKPKEFCVEVLSSGRVLGLGRRWEGPSTTCLS